MDHLGARDGLSGDLLGPQQVVATLNSSKSGVAGMEGDEDHTVVCVRWSIQEVVGGDAVALQLALEERPECAYPGLGGDRRFAPELGDVDRDVGRRPPEIPPENRSIAQGVRLLGGDKSTTISPMVSTSSGFVSCSTTESKNTPRPASTEHPCRGGSRSGTQARRVPQGTPPVGAGSQGARTFAKLKLKPVASYPADALSPERLAQDTEHPGEFPAVFLVQVREQLATAMRCSS